MKNRQKGIRVTRLEKDGRHHRLNVYGIRIDLHVGYRGVMIAVRLNAGIEYLQTNLMPVS